MRRLAFVLVAGAALLTAAGAIAAVAATPSQRPAQEPIDSDKDGLTDPYDACVLKPGGPYDSNKNGCPGPYNWLPMHISYGRGSYIEGGITYLRALSLSGLPAGTKVTIRGRGVYLGPANYQIAVLIHRLTAKRDGVVTSSAIKSVGFTNKSRISIRAVLPGWIGYLAELQTYGNASPRVVKKLCIPAVGPPNTVSCGSVDPGR